MEKLKTTEIKHRSHLGRILWGIGATVLLGVILASAYIAYYLQHDNFHAIVPAAAYRSAQLDKNNFERYIRQYGIKSIFNLRGTNKGSDWYEDEIAISNKLGVKHYDFSLSANRYTSAQEIDDIVNTIREAPKPILVHCKIGADRTGLISSVYLYKIAGKSPQESYLQLSWLFGHSGFVRPSTQAMDNSFWDYVAHEDKLNSLSLQEHPKS